MRLRHEHHFQSVVLQLNNRYETKMSRNTEINSATTTTTATTTTETTPIPSARSGFNVIESLKQYNRSQINKISCIENDTSALDHDVGGVATHDNDMRKVTEPATIAKTVLLYSLNSIFSFYLNFVVVRLFLSFCVPILVCGK